MSVLFAHFLVPQDNRWRPNAAQLSQLINRLIDDKFLPPYGEDDRWATYALYEEPKEPDSYVVELPPLPSKQPLGFLSKWLASAFPAQPVKVRLDPRPAFGAGPEEIESVVASVAAMIEWNVPAPLPLGIRYPLRMPLFKQDDYGISVWLSQHFNFSHNDAYGCVDDSRYLRTQCACSEELYFEPPAEKGRLFVVGGGVLADCPKCGRAFVPGEQMVGMVNGFTGEEYLIPGGLCFRFAIVIDCDRDSPEPNPDESVDHILGERRVSPAFLDACRDALGVEFREISHWT